MSIFFIDLKDILKYRIINRVSSVTKTKSIEIVPVRTNLIIDFDSKKQHLNPEIRKEIDNCLNLKLIVSMVR